jgi:hypothetical protein
VRRDVGWIRVATEMVKEGRRKYGGMRRVEKRERRSWKKKLKCEERRNLKTNGFV